MENEILTDKLNELNNQLNKCDQELQKILSEYNDKYHESIVTKVEIQEILIIRNNLIERRTETIKRGIYRAF